MSDFPHFTVKIRRGCGWASVKHLSAIRALEIAAEKSREGVDAEIYDSAGNKVWPRMAVGSVPPQAKAKAGSSAWSLLPLLMLLAYLAMFASVGWFAGKAPAVFPPDYPQIEDCK